MRTPLLSLLMLLGCGVLLFGCYTKTMTATAIPRPKKKVLLTAGQSNATTVADAKTFEDLNRPIALRNPVAAAVASYFTHGNVRDEVVLPDAGFGAYQTIDYRGSGLLNVRYLTFFNPASTCVEKVNADIAMSTYPGTVEVAAVLSATKFTTKMLWQISPVGKVTLTRRRTGTVHTISAVGSLPSTELTVAERFDPPLEENERFDHTIAAGQNSASGSVVTFYNQYGGYHDPGGVAEAAVAALSLASYPVISGRSVWEVTFVQDSTNPGECYCREHAVYVGQRVRFIQRSGTLPSPLATATDYYVTRLMEPDDSSPETHYGFYVSASVGGAEIAFGTVTPADFLVSVFEDGRDSTMAGMNLRCISGTNAGETRAMGPITRSGAIWTVTLLEGFTSSPQQDDVFVIEPPAVGDTTPSWDQWAYFLPVCQFNGRERGLATQLAVTITTGATSSFINYDADFPAVLPQPFYKGCPVRFYRRVYDDGAGTASGQAWPTGLLEGKTYYVVAADLTTGVFQVSATYDGPPITLSGTSGVKHWVQMAETWLQKHNPAPPGFNFHNQKDVPVAFQPYRGPVASLTVLGAQPKIAYHWGLAQRLSESFGEDIYVIDLGVGGTFLAQAPAPYASYPGVGWMDPNSMTHWAPGPSGLRARLVATLDAAQLAAEREGVDLEVVAFVWPQGEADAGLEETAGRYYANLAGFKRWLRAELVRRGMWPRDPDLLPFLQPQIRTTRWPFAATVNSAISRAATSDPRSRTWSVDGYTLMPDNTHYDGTSMNAMAATAAGHILELHNAEDIVLRIAQLALKIAGEKSTITSLYPPDAGSTEAAMCATFYPEARDHMIDRHAWDFAVRSATLVAATNDRTDWAFAYELPDNFGGVIALGPDILSAYDSIAVKIKHSIEINSEGRRVLYANQPSPLQIRFKAKVIDPAMFSSSFVSACATYMASMIVRDVMKGEEGIKAGAALEQRAYGMFRESAAIDARQTRDSSQPQRTSWRR